MKKMLIVVLGLILTSSAVHAANVQIDLEKSKSNVEFMAVGRPGFIRIHGTMKELSEYPLKGMIQIQGLKVTGSAKFQLDSLDTGMGGRSRHMQTEYLETQKYPEADFVMTKMQLPPEFAKSKFDEKVPFEGKLKLHGVERLTTGEAEVTKDGNKIQMAFGLKVLLGDYNIKEPHFLGMIVKDEIPVTVHVESVQALGR